MSADNVTVGLYQSLEVLQTTRRDQYLVPLDQYPHLENVPAVAIAHFEAWHLAVANPIVWRTSAEGLELCALMTRSLIRPPGGRDLRPRLAVAYPFAPAWSKGLEAGDVRVMYDRPQLVEGSTSQLMPIFDEAGEFMPEANERIEALFLFSAAYERTISLTRRLEDCSFLQPWSASMVLGGAARPLSGAFRLVDDWFQRFDSLELSAEDRPRMMELLQAHLVSLRHPDLRHGSELAP